MHRPFIRVRSCRARRCSKEARFAVPSCDQWIGCTNQGLWIQLFSELTIHSAPLRQRAFLKGTFRFSLRWADIHKVALARQRRVVNLEQRPLTHLFHKIGENTNRAFDLGRPGFAATYANEVPVTLARGEHRSGRDTDFFGERPGVEA